MVKYYKMMIKEEKISRNGNEESVKIPEPCIMVIFGASGDLTKRMLMPSLYKIYSENLLPNNVTVI